MAWENLALRIGGFRRSQGSTSGRACRWRLPPGPPVGHASVALGPYGVIPARRLESEVTVLVGMASAPLAIAIGYVASLSIGIGRTPYDHAAATHGIRSRSKRQAQPVKERAVRKSRGRLRLTILYSS